MSNKDLKLLYYILTKSRFFNQIVTHVNTCHITVDWNLSALQSRTGLLQGQNRDFPVKFSHTGKNLFSLQGTSFLRDFPVRKTSQGKPCFPYREGFAVQT